jgi:hypothetical protein
VREIGKLYISAVCNVIRTDVVHGTDISRYRFLTELSYLAANHCAIIIIIIKIIIIIIIDNFWTPLCPSGQSS